MNLANVFNTKNVINNGARCTLRRGDLARYINLPDQPIAVVVCNNTDKTTSFRVGYNDEYPQSFTAKAQEESGFSAGHIYLINPAVTKSHEIAIAISKSAPEDASLDVYLVSAYLPFDQAGMQSVKVPVDGEFVAFQGYSRMYCTPQFTWYLVQVDTTQKGLVSLFFQDDAVKVIGLNLEKSRECAFKDIVTIGSGMDATKVTYELHEESKWQHEFFGSISQIVYSPIKKADKALIGQISMQREED